MTAGGLDEGDELLRLLVESLGDRIFKLDAELRVERVYQSAHVAELFAQANHALLGRRLADVLPAVLTRAYEQACAQVRREHQPCCFTYDLGFIGEPDQHREARVAEIATGFLVIVRDISDRHQMQRRLRQSEALLRQVEETAQVGGWSLSPRGELLWTEQFARLHDLSPLEGIQSLQLLDCYPAEAQEVLLQGLLQASSEGRSFDLELPMTTRSGQERWVRVQGRAEPSDQGPWLLGATQDISARKRFEQQLIAAREEALVAAEAKSRFLANTSHEIRTPLGAVLGLVSLALAEDLPDEARDQLTRASEAGRTLLRLLEDLLDLARIGAGQLRLEEAPFSPDALLARVCAALRLQAQAAGLELSLQADQLPRLRGDAARLEQIVLNLVSNAIKFTERGSVELHAAWTADELRIEVRDTGIGIPEHQLANLFQPFAQVDSSPTRRVGGVGLGLSIARQLAEQMGGSLRAARRPEGGMSFALALPLPMDGGVSVPPAPSLASLPLHAIRTLIVEDNPINVTFLRGLLQRLGHEISVAHNGLQGVEQATVRSFDLIVMDVQMPVMDGLEAIRRIRALAPVGGRSPVVVALTASALPGEEERCRQAGADDFLEKPVRFDRLGRVLRHHFGPGLDPSRASNPDNSAGPPASPSAGGGSGREPC